MSPPFFTTALSPRSLTWSTYIALNAIFDEPEVTAFNLDEVLSKIKIVINFHTPSYLGVI